MIKQVQFIMGLSSGFGRAINAQLAETAKPPFRCKSILHSAATSVRAAIANGSPVGGRHCEDFLAAGVIGDDVPLMLAVARAEDPPLRLVLGREAYARAEQAYEARRTEPHRWRTTNESADYSL